MRPEDRAGVACAAAALLLTVWTVATARTRSATLNLGPGDAAFVSGFLPATEVEDKTGWRFSTYDAAIALPLETRAPGVRVSLRYARMFGEEATTEIRNGSSVGEPFRSRGGEVRNTTIHLPDQIGPLNIGIRTDSHERRNMGLKMDWVRVESDSGGLSLTPASAVRPVLALVLVLAALRLLGASPFACGVAGIVMAVAFKLRAGEDLFAAWRQTQWLPEVVVLSTALLLPVRRGLERLGLDRDTARVLVSASLLAIAARVVLVLHPDFYYPDLLTHTRVVETIRDEGIGFFRNPAEALADQGAWTKPVLGGVSSLPYAVMFHAPLAVVAWSFGLSQDAIETAMKLFGTIVSALPIPIAAVIAFRLGLPPLAALSLCFIPTYASRLSFALLPALFGHVFDLVILAILAAVVSDDPPRAGRIGGLAAALAFGHLAYTSSAVNEGILMACLVSLCLISGAKSVRLGLGLTAAEAFAVLVSIGVYYRFFLGSVSGLAGRLSGQGGSGVSVYPIESFWGLLLERLDSFFGWPWMLLAAAGVASAGAPVLRSRVVQAWGLGFVVLILLRAKIPDVFRYGHETLLLTPLVGLFAASAVIAGWRSGGARRLAAGAALAAVVALSLAATWTSFADQLSNAR